MAKKKKQQPKLPTPKNTTQKNLINAIKSSPMVITLGPAGTGKTYISSIYAGHYLKDKKVSKIILTRPTVPTGRSVGYFPGTLEEKMEPWCKPILSTLEDYMGKGAVECGFKNGNIEIVPFETIRGRSFENAFVILDEAQNTTIDEIKAFVTRQGEHSKVVVNGDVTQSDLHFKENGLSKIVDLVRYNKGLSKWCPVIEFSSEDIVRSGLCQLWVEAFEDDENSDERVGLMKTLSNGHAPFDVAPITALEKQYEDHRSHWEI
jgi:phosphate starvation-inducible PhoH-like protein